jgi:hypothetical protein
MARRTCFNCNNADLCIKLLTLCKSMVFRLRKFDYVLIDNAAKHCEQYVLNDPERTRKHVKKVNEAQRTFLKE